MGLPAGGELIVILVIILLLFGAKKLPELAGSMGKSIKEFKKATEQPEDDAEKAELKADTKPDAES